MSKFSYSVILPVYRELRNLRILIPRLLAAFKKINRRVEIVIVDDESIDGTREFILELKRRGEPIRYIERKTQKGFSGALITGTKKAKLDHLIHMDADLAHDPNDLLKMVAVYERSKDSSVVIGSRYLKKSIYKGKPFLNQISGRIASVFCRVFFHLPIVDFSNNFRIFPKKLWLKIYPFINVTGNVMLVQELILMRRIGASFVELPITYIERRWGESKLVVFKETCRFFQALPILLKNNYGKI